MVRRGSCTLTGSKFSPAHLLKAADGLDLLTNADTFLILQPIGSSFSESERTP